MNLALAFVPALVVIGILLVWALDAGNAIHALVRMLAQLLFIGYFLGYIFGSESALFVVFILAVMVFVSSWIALGAIKQQRVVLYKKAAFSILLGGGSTLILVTQGVLDLNPWYEPQYMIPLAGMIFANAMNAISLAAERFYSEMAMGRSYQDARNTALQTSLIPIINTLFAVGVVSLPGMMTGQILSGVSPLIAVRYQVMVMCMIFGSAGIASACFLVLLKPAK
ncbi:MAG: ABC transporter permease [Gammaproteobacteria bacterium]|nr:ABC transporter permease [Gammaproteobacteria bacterium]